jgi:hypothetical protein
MDSHTLAVLESTVRRAPNEGPLVVPEQLGSMVVLHRAFAESMPEFPLLAIQPTWRL